MRRNRLDHLSEFIRSNAMWSFSRQDNLMDSDNETVWTEGPTGAVANKFNKRQWSNRLILLFPNRAGLEDIVVTLAPLLDIAKVQVALSLRKPPGIAGIDWAMAPSRIQPPLRIAAQIS